MAKSCLVSSNVPIFVGLWKGTGLWVNWAPGALLWELLEPNEDVDADSDTSLLPF